MGRRRRSAARRLTVPSTAAGKVESAASQRIGRRWAAAIFFLALAFRGLCFLEAGNHPLFQYPVVDAAHHDLWAQRIAAGDWLGDGPDDVAKPPLYPYFLAALYTLFGRHVALVQWTQFVLGACSCVLLALLGARLLGASSAASPESSAPCMRRWCFSRCSFLRPR